MQRDNQSKTNQIWLIFLIMIVISVLMSVCVAFLHLKGIELPAVLNIVVSESIIVVPGIIYILINKYDFVEVLGFKKIKAGTFFMTILLSFCVMPVVSFVNVLSQFFVKNTMVQNSDMFVEGSSLLMLLAAGIIGPFCEEFMFRGIINNELRKFSSVLMGAFASAVMFGLMHLNVNQACYAFVLGLIFGIVNYASGSIWTSMIIHMVINTQNVLMLMLVNAASKQVGIDMVESAEAVRTSTSSMFVMAGVYLVLAIIFGAVSVPIVVFISKHEGTYEEFKTIFTKKKAADEGEPQQSVKIFRTIPAIVAIVVCLFAIFGLEPVLKLFDFWN